MSRWTRVCVSLALSFSLQLSQAAPGCRKPPQGAFHSSLDDMSGWSPEDSWSWPDSRGPPTTIRLPDGREFWPSDSRSVQDPRELGFEPIDLRQVGRFHKRLWDEYRDYNEKNATKGRRMKAMDLHYDLLQNTDLPIEEKADRFDKEAGNLIEAEKRTQSGESVQDKPGDLEKLSNLALKALKIQKKWYGRWYTEQPWKPRGFTTRNLDVNDMYSRYYGQITRTTRSSLEDIAYEEAFFRTMTEFTTLLPMDADWWIKALDYFSNHPNMTTERDYWEEAFHEWSRFTHPTTEHVSHRTINLTVFFDRRYTKNDTFDYFSLDQFKPKDWTDPAPDTEPVNQYELKDVVLARYWNTSTKVLPRANFFYSTYESEYDYNNSYSELDNLDFGHFQGESSEIESIRETPKTYRPHLPTCGHGFPRDSKYDVSYDVSNYDSLCVHITTERSTTAKIMHNVGFRNDMIQTGTTITVDMDVLLGRNTHKKHKRSTTTSYPPKRRPGRSSRARPARETCVHGLEITNDQHDTVALRGLFERMRRANDTSPKGTYRKRATRVTLVSRNVTRTRKMRKSRTTTVRHAVKRRAIVGRNEGKRGGNNEEINDRINGKARILGKLKSVIYETGRRKKRAIGALSDRIIGDKISINAMNNRIIGDRNANDDVLNDRIVQGLRGPETRFTGAALDDLDGKNYNHLDDVPTKALGVEKRQKRCPQSEMEYVSRGAKEKAYRSYEDYLKKTKHECPEDRICRHFKEELNRVDSFDGLGHWN